MMPNHLSPLGIFHTSISIFAVLAALFALIRFGKIDPKTGAGKIYVALTIVACITAFPIMKTGHFSAGHGLAVIVLVLLLIGVFAKSISVFGRKADHIQTVIMSATLFFSMIPATIETLTRLPIAHPLAAGPNDPVAKTGLMLLVFLFVVGVLYQLIQLKSRKKIVTQPTAS